MEVIENKFEGIKEECPHCHSILSLKNEDYKYASNCGELAGVNDGWAKYYDCPCCGRRVIVDSKDYEYTPDNYDKSEFVFWAIVVGITVLGTVIYQLIKIF